MSRRCTAASSRHSDCPRTSPVGCPRLPMTLTNCTARAAKTPDIEARLLLGAGVVAFSRGDMLTGAQLAGEAAELRRVLGDPHAEVIALCLAAHVYTFVDNGRAGQLLDEARSRLPGTTDPRLGDFVEAEIAVHLVWAGDLDAAEPMFRAILADESRTDFGADFAASYLADCAVMRGKYDEALPHYATTLRRLRGRQAHNVLLQCFGIATALAGLGRDSDAIELISAVHAIAVSRDGAEIPEELGVGTADLLAGARERLGPDAVTEAERRGRRRDFDETVEWALELADRVAVG